jgi:c-di-GMP-binding flagellar brake protein YcgR
MGGSGTCAVVAGPLARRLFPGGGRERDRRTDSPDMQTRNVNTLHDAIARQCGAVVSLPGAAGERWLKHYKSRFVAADPERRGFWAEVPAAVDRGVLQDLIAEEAVAGVSFRAGQAKVIFASPVRAYEPAYEVRHGLAVEAIRLEMPEKVNAVQRRNDYRVRVLPEDVGVRVWRMPRGAGLQDKPLPSRELTALALDLSVGGLGVTLIGKDRKPPVVDPVDRLRVALNFPQVSLLLEARLRHPAPPYVTDVVKAGLQFIFSEDMAGRQARAGLTRVVGELQRDEIRRLRLGLCA